jgi:hypothetical protein
MLKGIREHQGVLGVEGGIPEWESSATFHRLEEGNNKSFLSSHNGHLYY